MKFEFLEHTGDIKFRAYGKTLNEAFENVARAISSFLSNENNIKSKKTKSVEISGHDMNSLLYNYIEEILYLIDAENFIVSKAKVSVNEKENSLKAEFKGDDVSNYSGLDQIKAATYHDMYVKKTKSGYEIQTVVDV